MTSPSVKKTEIADELRAQIEEGHYQPGDMLPALPELIRHYGVSRETVRAAIGLLANAGLVLPERGRGTIVRDTCAVSMSYAPGDAARTWTEQTQGSGTDTVVHAAWTHADPRIADDLNITTGEPVVHRIREFAQSGTVIQTLDQWIPQHIAEALAMSLASTDTPEDTNLFALMADAGHAPASTTEVLFARMPTPSETKTLSLPPGTPVHVTHRTTRDANENPLETAMFVGAGDRVSSTFTVPLDY